MRSPLTGSAHLFGAGNRNRTGTLFTARDFKSLVSTYSTMPECFVILTHFISFVKANRHESREITKAAGKKPAAC